jgi:hypothetical protein
MINGTEVYPASQIKRRRATRDEMSTRRRRLIEIVEEDQPMTVRQVYYQAEVHGIVGKTDSDYDKIQNTLTELRRSGQLPFEWIIDEGRFARQPFTVEGIPQALNETRQQHRKDPWQCIPEYVQIWVEKNALLGVLQPVTDEYDVALMSAVGYSSISFLHQTARHLNQLHYPIYIYQFGDLDPSGAQAAVVIERDLREFAPDADIYFERIAVTPEQVEEWSLPSRPTKKTDPRYAWFRKTYAGYPIIQGGGLSVELDAIRPSILRNLVREVIERHLPRATLDTINAEGAREKARLGRMLDDYIETTKRRTWSSFGSDHLDALYQASPIKNGAAP